MLGKLDRQKAQSTGEYAIVIALVIAVVIGMQTYVKRGWQARLRHETGVMYNTIVANPNWNEVNPASVAYKEHYEPTLLSRETHEITDKDTETTQIKNAGKIDKTFERTTKQKAEDYQKYEY